MTRTLAALLGLALLAAPAAWAGNAGFAPPDSATDSGSTINDIYWIILGITGTVFLLVEGALLLFVLRFRRRRGTAVDAEGPQIHGNRRLELMWTVVPVLILVAITVVTVVKVPSVQAKPGAGKDALRVRVAAYQFYWQYEYPNGALTVDTLRLPVDRPVTLELTAPDVAHSWWVPTLTGKRDAIPGRVNELHFTPRRMGVFRGQCAEFCGIQHAVMRIRVEVLPQEEYDSWLEQEGQAQQAGTSGLGEQTFVGACAKCHGPAGEGDIGPPLAGNANATNKGSLVQILNEGRYTRQFDTYMPPVGLGWPDRQVDALIEYLKALPAPAVQGG